MRNYWRLLLRGLEEALKAVTVRPSRARTGWGAAAGRANLSLAFLWFLLRDFFPLAGCETLAKVLPLPQTPAERAGGKESAMANPEKARFARPQAPLTAAAAQGEKPAPRPRQIHFHGQRSSDGGGGSSSSRAAPSLGSGQAACSSSSRVLVTTSGGVSRSSCYAARTVSCCSIVSNAAAAPPVPSSPSSSPSSFYFLPAPPLFPSSSSFGLPSPRGGKATRASAGSVGAAATATAPLLVCGGGGGRRRLFFPSSIQSLLLPPSTSKGATGQRRHRQQRSASGPLLLCPGLSRLWSCNLLARGGGGAGAAASGDGPGGRGRSRNKAFRQRQQQRGTFFTFSSFSAPLVLGPDMEDGSSSASCFRRFTECFLSTSRWFGTLFWS